MEKTCTVSMESEPTCRKEILMRLSHLYCHAFTSDSEIFEGTCNVPAGVI